MRFLIGHPSHPLLQQHQVFIISTFCGVATVLPSTDSTLDIPACTLLWQHEQSCFLTMGVGSPITVIIDPHKKLWIFHWWSLNNASDTPLFITQTMPTHTHLRWVVSNLARYLKFSDSDFPAVDIQNLCSRYIIELNLPGMWNWGRGGILRKELLWIKIRHLAPWLYVYGPQWCSLCTCICKRCSYLLGQNSDKHHLPPRSV